MNRAAALLLFTLALAAGAWMAWRTPPSHPPAEDRASCSGEAEVCGEPSGRPVDAVPHRDAAAPRDPRRPGRLSDDATEADRAGPVVTPAVDGDRLREQADRLLADGRVHEAVDAMRKAAEVDPTARNHGDLGALLERLTLFDEAAKHLRAAAELEPANAERWLAAANAYYRAIEPGEAWKAERRAREAEPGATWSRDENGRLVRSAK